MSRSAWGAGFATIATDGSTLDVVPLVGLG